MSALLRSMPLARDLVSGAGAAFACAISAYSIMAMFLNLDALKTLGLQGLASFISTSLFVGALYTIYRLSKVSLVQESKDPSAQKLSEELEKIVRRIYESGNYVDVVRFGSQLSRPLWLGGRYKERIAIGEMVEESATHVQMDDERIEALIDGLGWTYVIIGNLEKAEENINHGIALAIEISDHYSAAKGERHLSGIYDRRNDPEEAEVHLRRALEFAENIENSYRRDEMKAGILFAQAELLLVRKDYDNALAVIHKSRILYEKIRGQDERLVKIHSRIGRIHMGNGHFAKAKDAFRSGLREAKRLLRADEIALNLLGLGEVYAETNDHEKAQRTLQDVIQLLDELGMKVEARKAKHLLVELVEPERHLKV